MAALIRGARKPSSRWCTAPAHALRELPVPVIARINGYALGAGLEVAAACDLRVAASNAVFGMPEVKVGIPSVVEAALLPGLIGWGRTRELLLFGENIDAATALAWGLVEQVVAPDALDAAVEARLAALLSARAAGGAAAEEAHPPMGGSDSVSSGSRRHRKFHASLRDRRAGADDERVWQQARMIPKSGYRFSDQIMRKRPLDLRSRAARGIRRHAEAMGPETDTQARDPSRSAARTRQEPLRARNRSRRGSRSAKASRSFTAGTRSRPRSQTRARKVRKITATENAMRRLTEEGLTLPVTPDIVRPEAIAARLSPDAVHQGLLVEADPLPSPDA